MLSFENEGERISFSKYYTPSAEIKYFNVLIDGKSCFDVPIKSNKEIYKKKILKLEKIVITKQVNLFDYEYFSNHYKLIGIDLSIGKLIN